MQGILIIIGMTLFFVVLLYFTNKELEKDYSKITDSFKYLNAKTLNRQRISSVKAKKPKWIHQ